MERKKLNRKEIARLLNISLDSVNIYASKGDRFCDCRANDEIGEYSEYYEDCIRLAMYKHFVGDEYKSFVIMFIYYMQEEHGYKLKELADAFGLNIIRLNNVDLSIERLEKFITQYEQYINGFRDSDYNYFKAYEQLEEVLEELDIKTAITPNGENDIFDKAKDNYNEHLEWAKGRAIVYLDNGDLTQGLASFMSDMSKHEILKDHIALKMVMIHASDCISLKNFIKGFN